MDANSVCRRGVGAAIAPTSNKIPTTKYFKQDKYIMNDKMRLGWIGTGIMGQYMAGHLLKAGYALTIYTRTKAKAESLIAAGAKWADSPRAVGENSDIVFTIVGYPKDVEEVILGSDGVLAGLKENGIICDMTTSSPDLAVRIAKKAKEQACFAADAPVTGGDVGAKAATLSIFVGAEQQIFLRLQDCLAHMGKCIAHCGDVGMGQRAKLANQIAIAGVIFSVCESLLFAREAGIDLKQWIEMVKNGAAGSTAMAVFGPKIIEQNFEPGFYVEHFVKDLKLCVDECHNMGLILPGLNMAAELYRMMQAQGYAKNGIQSLTKALASLSGKNWSV